MARKLWLEPAEEFEVHPNQITPWKQQAVDTDQPRIHLQQSVSGAVSKRRDRVQQALPTTGLTILRELGADLPDTAAETLLVATAWRGCDLSIDEFP